MDVFPSTDFLVPSNVMTIGKSFEALGTLMTGFVIVLRSDMGLQRFLVLVLLSAGVTPVHACGTVSILKYKENCFVYVECFVLFSKYFVLVFKMNDNFTLHISNSNGNFKQFNLDLGFINKWEQQSKLHLLSNISSLDSCLVLTWLRVFPRLNLKKNDMRIFISEIYYTEQRALIGF